MKFLAIFAVAAVVGLGSKVDGAALLDAGAEQQQHVEQKPIETVNSQNVDPIETLRIRKAAYGGSSGGYGGASIPAPPCPKNYLFSCQPNLQPLPCAAPQAAGYQGSYSANVPIYAHPLVQPLYIKGQ